MTDSEIDFQTDVIEASRNRPILVDFWAPWCGPCRTLGPVLEKLDREAGASWTLVKINTDQQPEISARYGIRGIPAVKLFVDGEVVDEFTGALPEYAVRQWLDKALPSRSSSFAEAAERALAEGDSVQARRALQAALQEEPRHPAASALLASILVFSEPDRALELAADGMSGEPRHVQISEAVRVLADFRDIALPEEPGSDLAARAQQAVMGGDHEAAVLSLLSLLQSNRYYADDLARKAGVALFIVLGPDHEVTRKHRRTFDMWLS